MNRDEGIRDLLRLIEILDIIERQLGLILEQRKKLFRSEYIEQFPGPWDEVSERLDGAKNEIRGEINKLHATDMGKGDYVYEEGLGMVPRLEEVGMLGHSLNLKWNMLKLSVQHKTRGRFLKLANSILGSLAKVIPGLDFVKEYKEHLEAAIKWHRTPAIERE